MNSEEIEQLKKAGQIAKKAIEYSREIVKKGVPLLEIAEKIDLKIIELGGKSAFPVNLSIDEAAAHCTPAFDDKSIARGLLKIDIGVHLGGYIADTAITIDLEGIEENKKLIEASEAALAKAIEKIDMDSKLREIGKIIEKTIMIRGFQPIRNLSGHSIERYNLHSGITIPNYDNTKELELSSGVFAIEPFSTNGLGSIKDGKPSGIFAAVKSGNVREEFSREVLAFILSEYKTLPFCSRWIYKKFGSRGLLALRRIEEAGILHQYSQLIERGSGKVAQFEHTVILSAKEKIITTI